MVELPPLPWVRERDVDLLVAELFATEPSFTAWLLQRELRRPADIPTGVPNHVNAVVSFSRPDASTAAAGETDVLVTARYLGKDTELVLSIENKVWAAPQQNQGRRHRDFVEESGARWRLAILIGPRAWIEGHPNEADEYHLSVALEELVEWCRAHAFGFRAAVFEQACRPPAFDLAPDLQDWHAKAARLLEDHLGVRLAPQRFVRTRNAGQVKPNRWASCDVGTLARPRGAEQPWIVLKPASANHTSRAAIELAKAPAQVVEAARSNAQRAGLELRLTSAGTLIVEQWVPEAHRWTLSSDFEEQVPHLLAIGGAALRLQTWWNALVRQHGLSD